MAGKRLQAVKKKSGGFLLPFPELGFSWNIQPFHDLSFVRNIHDSLYSSGLFASVSQMRVRFGVSSKCPNVTPKVGFQVVGTPDEATEDVTDYAKEVLAKKKKSILKVSIKVRNPHLRRLLSGGIVGAVSQTCVAPMEKIRTHLMVGSNGNSTMGVFQNIMKIEGWKGLFCGNFVNIIHVAPSKAIEKGAYENLLYAFVKIIQEEGPTEIFRGLTPSPIGVVPYATANYYAYDSLKKLYRKALRKDELGNVATLLIGSSTGAISSSATFPLEVARKHMQVGVVGIWLNEISLILLSLNQVSSICQSKPKEASLATGWSLMWFFHPMIYEGYY